MRSIKTSNGLTLSYQDCGNRHAPTIILIMGLGAQMTVWPDELYFGLVDRGFRVIRFDNRDTGLSSHLDEHGTPNLFKTWLRRKVPFGKQAPYSLEDMADDVLALMKALKIKKAHLVGASMGGMIAQILAAKQRKKVLSLTSIMSNANNQLISGKSLGVLLKLARLTPRNNSPQAAISYNVRLNQLIGSPAYPRDEQTLREQATMHISRAHNPAGFKRQLAAITASGDRRHLLTRIKAPTLVIHGTHDPIFPLTAGQQTAAEIRKARLKIVEGLGHDFPPMLMGKMAKWIAKHVKKAELKRLKKKRKKKTATKQVERLSTQTSKPDSSS
ncbi:alpha/beta hydrolase [Pseudoalteromonas sp. McH1-42]|uniref:alpha/beta fold hydrolase n=1 Tax=Pseudoalteromonas sp. McH1-42 TaxID=2917752 RepID=UPI001EF441F1|nr:alpha/beta hydrolase [Pseudoalteromonas sp. McH1-42]MCG7563008.1 alpha/beta hydrolase [Pseudoalteromonas sp. McH1-42]